MSVGSRRRLYSLREQQPRGLCSTFRLSALVGVIDYANLIATARVSANPDFVSLPGHSLHNIKFILSSHYRSASRVCSTVRPSAFGTVGKCTSPALFSRSSRPASLLLTTLQHVFRNQPWMLKHRQLQIGKLPRAPSLAITAVSSLVPLVRHALLHHKQRLPPKRYLPLLLEIKA
jgi:hypothetical protein